jgi:hypothetical protein
MASLYTLIATICRVSTYLYNFTLASRWSIQPENSYLIGEQGDFSSLPLPSALIFHDYPIIGRGSNRGRREVDHKEFHNLDSSLNISRVIKPRMIRWEGHVARIGEGRHLYKMLVGKLEGKRPLARPRRRWDDSSKIYEGRLQGSWTGGSAPLLCRGRRWLMPSCSGEGNVVVAWSSPL